MDNPTSGFQDSSGMSISSDEDGFEQEKAGIVELEKDHAEAQPEALLQDPELGMTFYGVDDVREYYNNYAKSKGFGVTRRSSHADDDGGLKYLTLYCSRYGKTQSHSKNLLKPNPSAGLGCKAKINITRRPSGKFQLSKVILDHNHTLSPLKSRLFRCNKKLNFHVKRRQLLNDRAGIRVNKNFNSFVVGADGHENLTFGEKDCRNFLEKERRLKLGSGDAEAVREYFVKMQSENPNFFSVMDVDDESRLRNVFWADARSRAVYDSFNDVISFDTTYLMNKYDMPFALFVGVNHHGQSVLLGCALLSNEDTKTFVWLFKASLRCMSNGQPKAIITYQAKAIQNAVEKVFLDSRYRWCLWHIKKKKTEQKEKKKAAQEEKKKAFQKARSTNSRKKGSSTKRKSPEYDTPQQDDHVVNLDNQACGTTIQESFDLGIGIGNINPTITTTVPYGVMPEAFDLGITTENINPMITAPVQSGVTSTMVMPPIFGNYTSLLLEVQKTSAGVSSSTEMQFDGAGMWNNRMNQS